jgi:hypothetical protein
MAFKIIDTTVIDNSRNFINAASVGIGTTNPQSVLHIIGNTISTGIITASQFVSNVAQGTAPISVASSTLVSNLNAQYLNSQPGSYYNNAANLTGQAPGSVISQSSGLTITGNLSVSGNVSVSGTSFLLSAQSLRITDRDITLGITTNALGDDVSTDTTANHGGIAIASTEGTPFLNVPFQAGINTDPSTYKQIMWVRQGNYSGMGTDAWLFNYGVSIGNTASLQNGSRLTVGAGFTVYDTLLDTLDIRARNITAVTNINSTGIITATTLNSTVGTITNASGTNINYSGIGTIATLNSTTATITAGTITNASGTNINYSGIGTIATLNSTTATITAGTITNASGTNVNYSGIGTITTLNSTVGTITNASGTNINYSGIGTIATLNSTTGNITNVSGTNVNSTGINTAAQFNIGVTTVLSTVSSQIRLAGIATIDATTRATLERELAFAPNDFDSLNVSGISTLRTTTLIGGGTSTGTANQVLQVTGISSGAYIGGSLGIGVTLPSTPLDVNGSVRFRTSITDNSNATGSANQVLTAGPTGAGVTWATLNASAVGAISAVTVTNDTSTVTPLFPIFTNSTGTSITGVSVDSVGLAYIPSGAGNLGIGTTSPTRNLDVNGDARIRGGIYDVNNVVGSASSVLTANGSGGWSWQSVTSTGAIAGINVTQDDTGIRYPLLAAGTNATTTAQYVDATALVYNTLTNSLGIGSLTPTSRLDIIGDARISGIVTAGDFNSTSDRKLKTNIQVISNPIEKVLQISGVSFNWKETGKATMGVIAQEIETVLPELVSDTDPKTVNYNGLIGLLIECVKDQQKQIDELKGKL